MNPNDHKSQLRELGKSWKNDPAFTSGIIDRLFDKGKPESDSMHETGFGSLKKQRNMDMLRFNLIGLASAVIVVLCVVFLSPEAEHVSASSLSEAIRKAIADVRTVHAKYYRPNESTGELEYRGDMWVDRETGSAVLSEGSFEIHDGQYRWSRKGKDAVVTREKSRPGQDNLLLEFFDHLVQFSKFESEEQFGIELERLPNEDTVVAGQRQRCYVAILPDSSQRVFLYVSPDDRVSRQVSWKLPEDQWIVVEEVRFQYDVEVDPAVFVPRIEKGTKVVDLDQQFDRVISLEKSLCQSTVDGFVHSVHRAIELQEGGAFLLTSARPSKPGTSESGMHNFFAAQSNCHRITLGEARHGDVHAQWWVVIPRNSMNTPSMISDGLLSFNLGATPSSELGGIGAELEEKIKETDVKVKIENVGAPISLEQAAIIVHQDQGRLPNIQSRTLNGFYVKDGTPHLKYETTDSISQQDFSNQVVESLEHKRERDRRSNVRWTAGQMLSESESSVLYVNGWSDFGDEDLLRAVGQQELVKASLVATSITDAGLARLIKEPNLKSLKLLSLRSTGITDQGLWELEKLKTLEFLDVRGTKVTKDGVDFLKASNENLSIRSNFGH